VADHDPRIRDHLSELWNGEDRDDGDRRVLDRLSVQWLRRDAAAQAGRLLRLLFLRFGALSTGPGDAFRRYAILLRRLSNRRTLRPNAP
jgi:hypothetical protein